MIFLKYLSEGTQGILSTKFSQPKLATASQIVSLTLGVWRLNRSAERISCTHDLLYFTSFIHDFFVLEISHIPLISRQPLGRKDK